MKLFELQICKEKAKLNWNYDKIMKIISNDGVIALLRSFALFCFLFLPISRTYYL